MDDILIEIISHKIDALIDRLAFCETANDMLLVDEAFHTIEDTVLSLIGDVAIENDKRSFHGQPEIEGISPFFVRDMMELWTQLRDDYRTAFAKKEYALMGA